MKLKILSSKFRLEKKEEDFFLIERIGDKERAFKINEIIYLFLSYFQIPNDISNVIKTYSVENEIDLLKVNEIMYPFYNEMIKKGIITKDGAKENLRIENLKTNKQINKFTIKEILSDRKYGEIYLIEKNNKKYILKTLNHSKIGNKTKLRDTIYFFQNEYNILKSFKNDKIIEVYDYLPIEGYECIVMEYFKSNNLRFFIHNLTYKEKEVIIIQILEGYYALHDKGVLHGDIHTDNILVNTSLFVKIIDFGLSHKITEKIDIKYGGLHLFLPPERIKKSSLSKFYKKNSLCSEVYQVGVLIYFIYFEKLPYYSETWSDIYEKIINYDIEKDENIHSLSHNKKYFFLKSLSKDENYRFKNCVEQYKNWVK